MENKPTEQEPESTLPLDLKPTEIDFAQADVSTRYEDVYQILQPNQCTGVRWYEEAYEFICQNSIALRIHWVNKNTVRLRYAPEGVFETNFSYALNPDNPTEKPLVKLNETDHDYILSSEAIQVVVSKKNLQLRFFDHDDQLLCEDAEGYSARRTILKGWNKLSVSHKCYRKDVFYGLGDKTCSANLHGKAFENWCTDSFAFGRDTDPLYRAVPFYYALHQGIAYGIFLDNPFRTHFDFNSHNNDAVSFAADGGELNYYFIYGPGLTEVAVQYSQLTGTHPLPAIWTLGYHQCRWSYYPHSKVVDIAEQFRKLQIPCDAIYLDIDYMDGFRVFTWNYDHFPDPKGLIDTLRALGFQTVVMIDPGIKDDPHYPIYREAFENDYLLKNTDGQVAKAPVWPGFCGFPDFTNPTVRSWWGELYRGLYEQEGIAGFWNDMNEPAVFHVHHKTLPDNVLHHYEGETCGHRKAHNIYGMQMARASWEGMRNIKPNTRPFLLTRANFSGGQRYSAVWTGDNVSDWEHLQIANIQCVRLSISGFSFCGTDIGGFAGNVDGELFVRWLQLAVFHPLMRVHSMGQHDSGDTAVTEEAQLADPALHVSDQEPWSFGEKWTHLAKKAIELRYSILPCLYTAMWQHHQFGTPVLRHLAFADPLEPRHWDNERDFLFGEHLMVSPVVQAKTQRQMVVLPKGNWYYFWTGQAGNGEMFVNIMPDQIPFFVREGAVLPIYPIRQWTGEKDVDELTLYIYYKNGAETSTLYEDEGEGYGYEEKEYCLTRFETIGTADSFTLQRNTEGIMKASYVKIRIYLVGFPTYAHACVVDGAEMPIKEIRLRDRSLYTVDVGPNFKSITWNA